MVADLTITRLGATAFRVVTGAGFLASDLAWLRWQRRDDEDVVTRDVSGELATIGLWGPRARDVLGATTKDAIDDGDLPMRTMRTVQVGPAAATVEAARISYAGELGWELTVDATQAIGVWDALATGGRDHGLEPFGYRALDGLRMEKGYRYYSIDMTMLDTPFEAGLGAFVRLDKGDFIGREANLGAREASASGAGRRLSTMHIGADDAYLPIHGGEAVRVDGEVIGRLRSVAQGPVVGRTIGYVYRPRDLPADAQMTVDVFDERVTAALVPDVSWDPTGERMRG